MEQRRVRGGADGRLALGCTWRKDVRVVAEGRGWRLGRSPLQGQGDEDILLGQDRLHEGEAGEGEEGNEKWKEIDGP